MVVDLKKKIKDAATSLGIGGLATLPVYSAADGVASVTRRGIRVPVKPQGAGSGSEGDSEGDGGEETYRGLGSGPPKPLGSEK